MKRIRLFTEHHDMKRDVKYRPGDIVDFEDDVADFINNAEVQRRKRMRDKALDTPGTPERRKKYEK